MNKGILYAIGAYVSWGILPVYWKLIHHVPAVQLLSHRILWSFFALIVVILLRFQWSSFRATAFKPLVLRYYFLAAILICINWLTYVWAVIAGHIVEASLGYFINPLLNVLIGVMFLGEHLRARQWIPIGLVAFGVIHLTVAIGSLPWIALTLAVSFALYGLVKKVAPMGSIFGLTLETGILLLPAIFFLCYSESAGTGAFLHSNNITDVLLIGAGIVTTAPLILFASATQRIPLSLVGVLQYIAPTLQFLVGIFVYSEPFPRIQFIGYSIVWIALILFGVESYISHRVKPVTLPEMQ